MTNRRRQRREDADLVALARTVNGPVLGTDVRIELCDEYGRPLSDVRAGDGEPTLADGTQHHGAVTVEPWGAPGDDWIILIQEDPRHEMVMPLAELLAAARTAADWCWDHDCLDWQHGPGHTGPHARSTYCPPRYASGGPLPAATALANLDESWAVLLSGCVGPPPAHLRTLLPDSGPSCGDVLPDHTFGPCVLPADGHDQHDNGDGITWTRTHVPTPGQDA